MDKDILSFARIVGIIFILLFTGLIAYLFPVSVSGASFTGNILTPPIVITPNSNQHLIFNITNTDQTRNITQVNITLPQPIKQGEVFIFIFGSNETTAFSPSFTNTSTILSWQNTTPSGLIESNGWATFSFNVSLPNYPGIYLFNISTLDTAGNYNSTTINLTVNQPVELGQLPADWGDDPLHPPFFWVNITKHIDFFFADGMTVYMSANFTNQNGGVSGLNVTVNFTAIGDKIKQAVDMGNGIYEANGTINYSAIGSVRNINPVMVSITVRNGTDFVNFSQYGEGANIAPIILVNMSTMPSCPPEDDPDALPPYIPWDNGSGIQLWAVAGCIYPGQEPCTSNIPGIVQINSTHVVICGPNWGPETTNFTEIASDPNGNFSNIQLVLQIPGIAKINFTEGVDFMGRQGEKARSIMEFAMKNLISAGRFGINESEWDGGNHSGRYKPKLINVTARLTLYNISGLLGITDAGIAFGNFTGFAPPNKTITCPPTRCQDIVWDGENLTFTVTSFSTYIAGNVTHNLTFVALNNLTRTVVTNQNATYYINITNYGNATQETYNLSVVGIGTINATSITLNQSESVIIELNVTNSTPGIYTSYIVAYHWNGTGMETDWNLSSIDDGVNYTTTIQNAVLSIIYPINGTNITSIDGIWLNFTTNTNLDTCILTINDSTTNITIPNCENMIIGSGNFTEGKNQNITIYANDTYGNGGVDLGITSYVSFSIDNTPPSVIITYPINLANISGNFSINASVIDSVTGVYNVWYNVTNSSGQVMVGNMSGDGNGNYSAIINSILLSDGNYNITIYAIDYASNTNNSEYITITIDNTPPSVIINSPAGIRYNTNFTINATVIETTTSVDVVRYVITNSSGTIISNTLTRNGATNDYNTTFDISVLADGSYNLTIIANNTAGVVNNTEWIEFTIDTTGPSLIAWNYSFITRQLILKFDEIVNTDSLDLSKFNITYNDGSVPTELMGLSGTIYTSDNSTTIVVNFTGVMDTAMRNLKMAGNVAEGQIDMASGAVKDLVGNDAQAVSNLGYTKYINYGIEIDLTAAIWNPFNLPRTILENRTSLGGNYSVENVLSSISGHYKMVYYYDGTSWKSYMPGRAVNDFLTFIDDTGTNTYWIYMNVSDKIQIE